MVTESWSSTRVTVVARVDAPSLRPPFGYAVFHAVSTEAFSSQERHSVEGGGIGLARLLSLAPVAVLVRA
jgi:hypothetical protein